MMLRRSVLLLLFLAGVGVGVAPREAHASVSVALSLEDLARHATSVARVTALDSASRWEDGRIVTYTHVRVDEPIAGSASRGAVVSVRTLGGVVEGVGQIAVGEPRFTPGAASIVFLAERSDHALVVGRAQGQLAIEPDRAIVHTVRVGALVVRTPRVLPSALEGRDVSAARDAILRAWEAAHAP